MTATIVPFHAKPEQNISEIEALMRKWLAEISPDTRFIDSVATKMVTFIETYASQSFEPSFNLAAPRNMTAEESERLLRSIEKGVDQAAEQVQEMINKIIVERFLLEIELYKRLNTDQSNRPIVRACKRQD